MARPGRKSQSRKRTKSGRISRAGYVPLYDHGTERAQLMKSLYGEDGTDAPGRAFRMGLLGEGTQAKAMLDTARKVFNAYWAAYEQGGYQCALGDRAHGGGTPVDPAIIKAREERLAESLKVVRGMGEKVRKAFTQLCIDPHPDSGPLWLDKLIWAERKGIGPDIADQQTLRAALDALETLAS